MSLRVPTSTELTDYRQTTTLDGRDYVFRFLWNQREGTWFFSLFDEEDDPIVQSVKVTVQLPLLRLVTDPRKPPGILLALDTQAVETDFSTLVKTTARDPGIAELGERVLLLYFTADEVAGLEAA
jgi:hypothetical protein